jgi:hypothetical protein
MDTRSFAPGYPMLEGSNHITAVSVPANPDKPVGERVASLKRRVSFDGSVDECPGVGAIASFGHAGFTDVASSQAVSQALVEWSQHSRGPLI